MNSIRKLAARALHKAGRICDPPKQTRTIEDEYLLWLGYANSGMVEPGNSYLIYYVIQRLPSGAPIVEIGTFCGLSANIITHFKRKYGLKNSLFTCDKWDFENVKGRAKIADSPILFSDYRTFVRESFIRNVRMFSPDHLPYTIEMNSDEFFSCWQKQCGVTDVFGRAISLGGPVSFCYIDGNHTYEYAKRDFQNCDTFLESGGFILFDDSTLTNFGVWKLMPEIVAGGKYKLIDTNPYHLFQKR
jgi:Methyltransferase domain